MVLLKAPLSPRKCPVAMPDALAIVKVGKRECGLTKFTPLSRTAARAGAVSGATDKGRKPSGTKRIRLRWFCAPAGAICRKMAAHAAENSLSRNDIASSPILSVCHAAVDTLAVRQYCNSCRLSAAIFLDNAGGLWICRVFCRGL